MADRPQLLSPWGHPGVWDGQGTTLLNSLGALDISAIILHLAVAQLNGVFDLLLLHEAQRKKKDRRPGEPGRVGVKGAPPEVSVRRPLCVPAHLHKWRGLELAEDGTRVGTDRQRTEGRRHTSLARLPGGGALRNGS